MKYRDKYCVYCQHISFVSTHVLEISKKTKLQAPIPHVSKARGSGMHITHIRNKQSNIYIC